jgi:3-deoxy-D-manno-octulosonate 8-phosphate phosphatase (KDO 8-P phosphatase)
MYSFVLDVDGVLTDGTFLYSEDGKVLKKFGPHDSYMLNKVKNKLEISFISADHRGFEITSQRILDMGFKVQLVKENDRIEFIEKNYDYKNLIYMGDGDVDANIISKAFIGIAPSNSRPTALKSADYITENKGGRGAVAEAIDYLLEKNIC